jgi:predicted MFS family arabinose efflux permease
MLGDWALVLALPFYVYTRTGSVVSTGGLVAAALVPRLLLSSAAGVLADRWSRRGVMIAADLFRTVLVLALLIPAAGGPLWVVYAVALMEAAAAQLFRPAQMALLPGVVADPGRLFAANSLLTTTVAVTTLVGPPLGGLLYGTLGLGAAAIVDSASFALSALGILAIGREPAVERAGGSGTAPSGFVSELVAGARHIAADRVLTALCSTLCAVMVVQGMLQTALVPFARGVLHFGAFEYGLIAATQGVGSLVGAFGSGAISRRLTSGRVLGAGLLLGGVFLFGFTLARSLPLNVALVLLFSVPIVVVSIWMQTCFQQRAENRVLGRVLGLTENASVFGLLAGVAAASLLGGPFGVASVLMAAAVLLCLIGVAALFAFQDASTAVVVVTAPVNS